MRALNRLQLAFTAFLITIVAFTGSSTARVVRITLVGDSITESLSTFGSGDYPNTLARQVMTDMVAGAKNRSISDGGQGFIPAHHACTGGIAGCLPSGVDIASPWHRTGDWFDAGQFGTWKQLDGPDGMPSRAFWGGPTASLAVTGSNVSVLLARQAASGTALVSIDQPKGVGTLVAGSTVVSSLDTTDGTFLKGQVASATGLASGTRIEGVSSAGVLDGRACPCAVLAAPAVQGGRVQMDAVGPDPTNRTIDTGAKLRMAVGTVISAASTTQLAVRTQSGAFKVGQSLAGDKGVTPTTQITAVSGNRITIDPPLASTPTTVSAWDSSPLREDFTLSTPGQHSLEVKDQDGTVQLLGAVAENLPRADGTTTVVINQVGHGGSMVATDTSPNQLASLKLLRSDLTVTLRGINDEYWESTGHSPATTRSAFLAALKTRFRVARETGGCLFVPHAPSWRIPTSAQAAYQRLSKQAATATGCGYLNAFSSAWTVEGSRQLTVDGLHPTSDGYQLLARKLSDALLARPELG